ncbi:MAG: aldo/keto reductase [Fidelibacterota bacterium]
MNSIILGRTRARVSAVSLGTWSYGGENKAGGQAVGWAGQRDDDSRKALIQAWENGINHWDTADVYGNGRSETVIGSVWDTVPREEIFLATKVGWDKGGYEYYYHPEMIRKHVEQSLKNLRTETVDLYYLHHCNFGNHGEVLEAAVETLRQFRDEGKIRFIGLSDWFSEKIMRFIETVDPDVVQPYRNVMDDTYAASGLKQWVEDHRLGVCFFSPLKHGLLTGKYREPQVFPDGDFRQGVAEFQDAALLKKIRANRSALEKRFSDHPFPVLHGLVDALLTDVPTGCVLLGQRHPRQVAAAASLGSPLTSEEAAWVQSLFRFPNPGDSEEIPPPDAEPDSRRNHS